MKNQKEHFRFTIDDVEHNFECTPAQLSDHFKEHFPNYTLHIKCGSTMYTMGECNYYVQYQKWEPSAVNPHKGEKKTFTVELMHLFGFVDREPRYIHYTTP